MARIFDTAEEIPESYKGNKYVRTKRDEIVSLISYAVGCMFGRYSLDVDGLVLANAGNILGQDARPAHVTFMPDADNVLPITDDEYFEDDVVARFVKFVEAAYGPETLEMNLKFVADALDPKSKADARGTIRAYFLKDFYKDHCSTYKKRPIYWLLDSGKKNGFKALVYMHRWRRPAGPGAHELHPPAAALPRAPGAAGAPRRTQRADSSRRSRRSARPWRPRQRSSPSTRRRSTPWPTR